MLSSPEIPMLITLPSKSLCMVSSIYCLFEFVFCPKHILPIIFHSWNHITMKLVLAPVGLKLQASLLQGEHSTIITNSIYPEHLVPL